MTFDEVLAQVQELLQREHRVSYRGLKRRFALDDAYLEDLKEELIGAKRLAVDEDGRFLVWTGDTTVVSNQVSVTSPQPPAPDTQHLEAERRQLTVMFCDLVGSTALSAQLDPEELREVVRAYQQTSAAIIERFGGHIAQYLGDGLLVYFGYPVAHEDDAARAVRAGLEIVSALQKGVSSPLAGEACPEPSRRRQGEGASVTASVVSTPHPNLPPQGGKEGQRLQVRIGIHTGPVVVGEIGGGSRHEQLALGETPNLAARIQGQAEPDTVVISAATYRLVEGLFECEDRGQPALKGVATPLTLYRVVKESEARSRFQVVARKGLTPLVGRDHEYGLLHERWEQARDGAGQVVLLSGEPGIGKSRLVEALKEAVEQEGARCLELRCSPYGQNSALQPVIEHLQRVLGFQSEDSSGEKLHKLEDALKVGATHASPLRKDTIPLLASLFSLPHPEGYPLLTLSPQKQKEKTHAAIVAWLCEAAQQQAVVYAWEDLHWADPSTLELLTLFLNQVLTTRLLAVLTFRPEFTPPWGAHSYLSQLTLSRLGRSHVETMVEKVASGKVLSKEVIQQIVKKADGVPLFVEELTKSVVESVGATGRSPLQSFDVPATLQDSLMARLDRLGTAKEIAQVGATFGREFDYALLQAVSSLDEDMLQKGLKQLVEAELVYQSGLPPQARYLFKHALVQDTAYQSLLKSRRHQLHHQVAQVLVKQFPEAVESQPELVAHHYTEAGLKEQAIPYWQQAGQRASQRSANAEAISHITKGLELLKTLPDTPERTQQELTLLITLGAPLVATKGFTVPEAEKAYNRALELCRSLGETPQLFPVLGGLSVFYSARGELQTTRELREQQMRLAQSVQDPALLLEAHRALGVILFWLGELTAARAHLEQGIALYDAQRYSPQAFPSYVQDPKMHCLSYTAWVLWFLGFPDQALERMSGALTLAQEFSHAYNRIWAWVPSAELHQYCRERQLTLEHAEAAITLSTNQDFPLVLAMGTILRGWALAEQGQGEEGIVQIRQGITALRTTGPGIQMPYCLALLAEAYRKVGQIEEGLTALGEALAIVHGTGERWWEAEVYRLKGTLTLQKSGVQGSEFGAPSTQHLTPSTQAEAEACFLKAIEIARRQSAKSLELRAVTSLARLWQRQGKRKEAHQMLAEIYGWFTEGFDTKDLQEAKALLEELEC